jgi:hypothetical protein
MHNYEIKCKEKRLRIFLSFATAYPDGTAKLINTDNMIKFLK